MDRFLKLLSENVDLIRISKDYGDLIIEIGARLTAEKLLLQMGCK